MQDITISVPDELRDLVDDWSIRNAKREIVKEALICASGNLHSICELDWSDGAPLDDLERWTSRVRLLIRLVAELEEEYEADREGRELSDEAKAKLHSELDRLTGGE